MSRNIDPDLPQRASPSAEPATGVSLPVSEASALLSCFTNFLTVALHSILYHRKLYPQTTFLTARAYNLPVHQSRHPGVSAWIRDAVTAIGAQVRTGSVSQVALVIHAPDSFEVTERWIFDLQSFPTMWGDKNTPPGLANNPNNGNRDTGAGDDHINWTDVNEALRGALSKVSHAGQSRADLPEGCTFTMGVELRDQALPPIQHPQVWIPAQPDLQTPTESRPELGRAIGGTATTPIRSVQAGPLFFECWVEQGKLDPSSANAQAPTFSSTLESSGGALEATASSSS